MSEVPAARAVGPHRWLWVGAALFLLGLALGAGSTALLSAQSVRPAQEQVAEASQVGQGPTPTRAGVLVTDACLRAINDAGDALAAIDDAAQAAAELNAARLDEVVRRLQPVQDRLETDLGGCEAVAQSPDGTGGEGAEDDAAPSSDAPLPGLSPTGSPSPTGTPSSASPSP